MNSVWLREALQILLLRFFLVNQFFCVSLRLLILNRFN